MTYIQAFGLITRGIQSLTMPNILAYHQYLCAMYVKLTRNHLLAQAVGLYNNNIPGQ